MLLIGIQSPTCDFDLLLDKSITSSCSPFPLWKMEILEMTVSLSLQQHGRAGQLLVDVLWMTATPSLQSHLFLFLWTAAKRRLSSFASGL